STAVRDDAIDPITAIGFVRAQFEAELLANHPGEEAADRVLLPMGGTHDGSNRCSLPSAQHRQHASLFRTRPAFARAAGFGLRSKSVTPGDSTLVARHWFDRFVTHIGINPAIGIKL